MNPREIKNNAFSHVFQEPQYIAELYEHVSGKVVDPDTIRVTTLQSEITGSKVLNDASFIKNDGTLVVLFEHQSTTSENMALRLLNYYLLLHEKEIHERGQSLLGAKSTNPPQAEFYIPYNGKADFKNISQTLDLGAIQVKVKYVDIKLEAVKEKTVETEAQKSAVTGYATIVDNYEKFIQQGVNPVEAMIGSLRETSKAGYFPDLLRSTHLERLAIEWSRDAQLAYIAVEQATPEILEKGREQGLEQGLEQAVKNTIQSGATMDIVRLVASASNISDERLAELATEAKAAGHKMSISVDLFASKAVSEQQNQTNPQPSKSNELTR